MFGMQTLDVAIGLIFVYLVMSLVCTALREFGASMSNARSKNLEEGLGDLLTSLKNPFYAHPLIQSLNENGQKPSYIPATTFALALLDLVSPATGHGPATADELREAIGKIDNERVKTTLLILLNDADGDLKKLQANVERWFDDAMDRVSAWYKRRTQWILVGLAALIAFSANVDTVRIANTLSQDRALRDALVAQAQTYATQHPNGLQSADAAPKAVAADIRAIRSLGIPLGWHAAKGAAPMDAGDYARKLIGLLLSTFAISLGAPFWFDMLNKIVTIRAAGDTPNENEKKRQQ
ncbi:MAG TPA: hypothetical protein VN605_03065 [Thermoanaerobaculia bacterium]|nr:hypothetical protein [Thermoanaerobaculia bacterium]